VYYASPLFPLVALSQLATFVQYGSSERANTAGVGVPMIRMNNLQANGWDLSDIKHIELNEEDLDRYRLKHGDLLFNRTNSKELVGKCEVFNEDGDWVFASYLIRVQLAAEKVLPEFVSSFLNSPAGRIQIDQVSRQIAGMSNVNSEELRRLEVPLPRLDIQHRLVAELDDARRGRDIALAEAERLVGSFEAWAVAQIGMVHSEPISRGCYAVRRTSLNARIDPFYYAPEFVEIEREVRSVPHAPLGELVDFSEITWNPSDHPDTTFRYIEISGVDRRRGKAKASEALVSDAPSRARMLVKPNDILVSLTRPHHGSIALLDEGHRGCVASTGFAVIRQVDSSRIDRRFLWATLRLSLCLKQMLRRASGGNYPAITQDELANVLIPVPAKQLQKAILKEIMRRSDAADRLESHAEAIWREARTRFEQQLLKVSAA
jgi:restriction endonuclease S subunit